MAKMQDVMIDLETLATCDDAHILTFGACRFNPYTGEIDRSNPFYRRLGFANQEGRAVDPQTVKWWMQQSEEARKEIFHEECTLREALCAFRSWFPSKSYIWSNGVNFDVSIVRNAMEQCDVRVPWHYKKEMDVRTIARRARHMENRGYIEFEGTPHHALHDAYHQAKYISNMWRGIGREEVRNAA